MENGQNLRCKNNLSRYNNRSGMEPQPVHIQSEIEN